MPDVVERFLSVLQTMAALLGKKIPRLESKGQQAY